MKSLKDVVANADGSFITRARNSAYRKLMDAELINNSTVLIINYAGNSSSGDALREVYNPAG